MKKVSYIILAALVAILVCLAAASCGRLDMAGMFASADKGVESRFADSMKYNESTETTEMKLSSDSYKMAVFTDFHTDATTVNLDRFVEECNAEPGGCLAALYLGDMVNSDSGAWDLFLGSAGKLSCGHLFVTAGNHDLYFGQWKDFLSRFHTSTYVFYVDCGDLRDYYICLDSAGGTIGVSQREWLENVLIKARDWDRVYSSRRCRHITVFTHTHFFKRDNSQGHTSNYAFEETLDLMNLFSFYKVELVLTGHDHSAEDSSFRGVRYITVPALEDTSKNPGYVMCTVGKKGIEVEFRYLGAEK